MALTKVQWDFPDDRGPMGRVHGGGRKLVRLDSKSRASLPARFVPAPDTLQVCRVAHDTAPNDAGRGVLFVIPVEPPVDRKEAVRLEIERERAEVRAEWETCIRNAISDAGKLQGMIGGYMHSINPSTLDRRWHGQAPFCPRLRVVDGKAGIWSLHAREGWKEKYLDLPELGEGQELAQRLAACWSTQHCHGGEGKRRLADLELGVRDVRRKAERVSGGVRITWTGTFMWRDVPVSAPEAIIGDTVVMVPHAEEYIGDEEIPELDATYRAWAVEYLNHCTQEDDHRIVTGVFTTRSWTTPSMIGDSPDERSTREYGLRPVVDVTVGGEKLDTVERQYWSKVSEALGLREGEVVSMSRRQIKAATFAFASFFRWGCLGPRGQAAMLAIATNPKH